MKKLIVLFAAFALGFGAHAQNVTVYQGEKAKLSFAPAEVDSIVFGADEPSGSLSAVPVDGTWCSIGTSITWYNDNVAASDGRFTRGYQDRVMDKLAFKGLVNVGHNGGYAQQTVDNGLIKRADYYSVEHGINDWGHSIPVGTIDDYINNTKNGTFAAAYRQIIDKIFKTNARAKVVLCTPRKGYGFNGYLPDSWDQPKNGIYLKEYADLIRQIAEYESFPVADFFNECGGSHNLARLSIDTALHPNDDGYQMMANVLVKAFRKIIVD